MINRSLQKRGEPRNGELREEVDEIKKKSVMYELTVHSKCNHYILQTCTYKNKN